MNFGNAIPAFMNPILQSIEKRKQEEKEQALIQILQQAMQDKVVQKAQPATQPKPTYSPTAPGQQAMQQASSMAMGIPMPGIQAGMPAQAAVTAPPNKRDIFNSLIKSISNNPLTKGNVSMKDIVGLASMASGFMPEQEPQKQFTLSPGQSRFAGGRQIASMPAKPEQPKETTKMAEFKFLTEQVGLSQEKAMPMVFGSNEQKLTGDAFKVSMMRKVGLTDEAIVKRLWADPDGQERYTGVIKEFFDLNGRKPTTKEWLQAIEDKAKAGRAPKSEEKLTLLQQMQNKNKNMQTLEALRNGKYPNKNAIGQIKFEPITNYEEALYTIDFYNGDINDPEIQKELAKYKPQDKVVPTQKPKTAKEFLQKFGYK